MEQETKHKTKRAIAIAGIATLSAFALVGLFAIGALIVGCGEKKQPDAAASEQVKTAHTLRRAGADVAADYSESLDLLADSTWYHFVWSTDADAGYTRISYASGYKEAFIDLTSGYYRISFSDFGACLSCTADFRSSAMFFTSYTEATFSIDSANDPVRKFWQDGRPDNSTAYVYLPAGSYFFMTYRVLTLELVNAIQVPASDVLTLAEDWNPTAWVSREAIGGYPVIHTTYATEANASAAYVLVGWDDVVFKTAADSVVFTGLRVRYRWLWSGAKYLYNGQVYTYSWPSGSGNYWLWPFAVEYRDALGNWSVVASANQDWDGSNYIVTTRFNWVLPTYRTLGFIEHPVSPDHLSVRRYFSGDLSTSDDDWVLSPTLYGVTFAEWFGLASWDSPAQDVGAGNAIGLISTAFSGMVPILGISIFPNITLGLLLFLPLIGGIIVLIIKAVSK